MQAQWILGVVAGLVLLSLGGCLANRDPTPGNPSPPREPLSGIPFRFQCQGQCGSLTHPTLPNLGEPDAAIDPANPRRMAILAQALAPTPTADSLTPKDVRFVLFTTADEGRTWNTREGPTSEQLLPGTPGSSPGNVRELSDPLVGFGAGGRLFVGGIINAMPFLMTSDDFGDSWKTVISPDKSKWTDRPWLSIDAEGHLAMVWRNLKDDNQDGMPEDDTPGFAWSSDNGKTIHHGKFEFEKPQSCWRLIMWPIVNASGFWAGCPLEGDPYIGRVGESGR